MHATEITRGTGPLLTTRDATHESQNNDPDLRREVENIRRELERIKEVQEMAQEAPPLYEIEVELGLTH